MAKFQPPRATRDFLPPEAAARKQVAAQFGQVAESYGFQPIQTPIFEPVELFSARSGPEIKNSMLTFHCDHEEFALRPEMTAPVCRLLASGAFEGQAEPYKLYYLGPCFRYCRPQSGRYREFTQAGIECLGTAGPAADAEVIAAACRFLQGLGIADFSLKLGNIGIFRELLRAELVPDDRAVVIGHLDQLIAIDEKCRLLARSGSAALFDDLKIDRMELAGIQAETDYSGPHAIADHPQLTLEECPERLPKEAEASFRRLWSVEDLVSDATSELLMQASRLRGPLKEVHQKAQKLLAGSGASGALEQLLTVSRHVEMYQLGDFEVVLGIARGFTFYTSTVFEISSGAEDGGQVYCGGGRYDRLVEEFGGPSLPSTGCAFRFDSLVEAFQSSGRWSPPEPYQLFLLAGSEATLNAAVRLAEALRGKGLRVGVDVAASATPPAASDLKAYRAERLAWLGAAESATLQLVDGSGAEAVDWDPERLASRVLGRKPAPG